jgi:DNA-binding beta-propeller fold protein YncE
MSRLAAAAAAVVVLGAAGAGAAGGFGFLRSWGTAGTAPGALRGPDNIAVDLRGDVYVADRDNNRIEKFTGRGGFLRAIGRNGGDGSAGRGNGEFDHPRGVATDAVGNLWVADSRNNRIEKFGPDGRFLARFGRNGGDGTAGTARGEFNDPRGIATDLAGDLYVADHGNNRVQKLDPAGRFLGIWGRGGGDTTAGVGPGEFKHPRGVAVDDAGNLYVADKDNSRIQKFGPDGRFVRMWGRNGGDGSKGTGNGEFNTPYSVAVSRDRVVFVADTFNHRIQTFTTQGVFLARFGRDGGSGAAGNGPGEFHNPYGVAVDCRGSLYVTDEDNDRVEKLGVADRVSAACPPRLALGTLPAHLTGRALRFRASCDLPCTLTARARVFAGGRTLGSFGAPGRTLAAGRSTLVRIRLSPGTARRLRDFLVAHPRARVQLRVAATGFGGRSALVRSRPLRP